MSGNDEFIAAVVSRLQKQQEAFATLASTLESSLADVAKALEKGNTVDHTKDVRQLLGAIEAGVADAVAKLEKPTDFGPLIEALGKLNPNINVQVPQQKAPDVKVNVAAPPPANVTVEAVMPQQPAPVVHNHIALPEQTEAIWEVRVPGEFGRPDKVMTITKRIK